MPNTMSNTPIQEPPGQDFSSGSGQTLPSRPSHPISDPLASKRVCFYKSGDNKFSGHRMIISARTFKTFDTLLDALSKKVPLPFGVRTITTPHGTHLVQTLDDLHDGGSYVCSDQKRVKPLNLDEVKRRQVPWNTTRQISAGRRTRQRPATNRTAKVTERVAVRTPKKLVVISNRDPAVKRTIVLQKRTAPTFDALLDYLSQILLFPVLKLFSTDGRRVDGLAALILCSGVVVAARNEPFRLGNYTFHRMDQKTQAIDTDTVEPFMLQTRASKENNKSFLGGRGPRNFSLASERYIVDQINKSRNGSMNTQLHHDNRSCETEVKHHQTSVGTFGSESVGNEHGTFIEPHQDDIEKSFRVNQDGSMTVEMKVHLTIKKEEILHWTTTLSRASLSKRTVCASISESSSSSPDSNSAIAKDFAYNNENEMKEENHPAGAEKGVSFNNEQVYEGYISTALGKAKTGFKRTPTPGPRQVNKKATVESVKTVTESGVQESTMEHYSYMERTVDGEKTEGYRVVRHNSNSNKPIPKPRNTVAAGASKRGSHSSIRPSGEAEVHQIRDNRMEVTETVMHIYESQGCYNNYFVNEECSADSGHLHGSIPTAESQASTVSGPCSSGSNCDIDMSESLQRHKEEMLSLSSESITLKHETTKILSPVDENNIISESNVQKTFKKDKPFKSDKRKKMINPRRNQKSSTSTSSSDKKQKESMINPSKQSQQSSTDNPRINAIVGKKSLSSLESAKSGQYIRGPQMPQIKKVSMNEKTPRKEQALLANAGSLKRTPTQRQSMSKTAAKDNGHNLNTPTRRPQMKKNMFDILQPQKAISRPKSEKTILAPKKSSELSECFSMPSLNPSPSEVHQYVENWLEKVSPDPAPDTEDPITDEPQPQTKTVFHIGGDSESDVQNECQNNIDEHHPPTGDAVKKSASTQSVPICHTEPATSLVKNTQHVGGVCVSKLSVSVDPHKENIFMVNKSMEANDLADKELNSSTSNILSPKAKIKHVLQKLCSSVQSIRKESDTNATSSLEKSNSLPDFPMQVASVFGSSCKAFLSFLSVMTLRDNLTGNQSKNTSEAMLIVETLQKISAIGDAKEQKESLTDLRNRASSQFRERWKDFQILRARLESEVLSPKVSETEFAQDVVSEGGDILEDQHSVIDELMEELNMPQDIRADISSTIQQAKGFRSAEESSFVHTEGNQSGSEKDVKKIVDEYDNETQQPKELDTTCTAEDIMQTKQDDDDDDDDDDEEQTKMMFEAEQAPDKCLKTGIDVTEISQPERNMQVKENGNEEERHEAEIGEDQVWVNNNEDGDTNEINGDDDEETEMRGTQRLKDRRKTEEKMDENGREEWEAAKASKDDGETVDKAKEGREEVMIGDEEELEAGEKEQEVQQGLMDEEDQEASEDESFEETDKRDGVEETEEEDKQEDGADEEADEGESGVEGGTEVKKEEEVEEETDALSEEETQEGEEVDKISEGAGEEEGLHEEIAEEREEHVEEERITVSEVRIEEEEVEHLIERIKEGEEEKGEEQEEKESAAVIENNVEDEAIEEDDSEGELKGVIEEDDEEDAEERGGEEDKTMVVGEEHNEEEEENELDEVEDGEDVVVKNMNKLVITDADEVEQDSDSNIEVDEKCAEGEERREDEEKGEKHFEEESEEKEVLEETETEERVTAEEKHDTEERKTYEETENNELNEREREETGDEVEEGHVSDCSDRTAGGVGGRILLDEASYLQQQSGSEEEADAESKIARCDPEPQRTYTSEGLCEDDKGDGTDAVDELDTDEGGGHHQETSSCLQHPVEISQELLDFVNSALRSSSLIFTYDAKGNVRLEPDNAQVAEAKVIPTGRDDRPCCLKRLPSPSTSDLSDYRPETSESGGYETQDSVDVVTDSDEDAAEKYFLVCRPKTDVPSGRRIVEQAKSELSFASHSDSSQNSRSKSEGGASSFESASDASGEDLCVFSGVSSQKADPATGAAQCTSLEKDSTDGVLIDQGRWLLKENHLIRKSPPVCLGMYGDMDSSSIDTSQENSGEDSPSHSNAQHNPLTALSSSELEEMAKPQTPKCTYYNMPHGSDSDPFLDESTSKSGRRDTCVAAGRGFRVSPTIDTTRTWASINGSLSSFTSVEFKAADRKVHPEGGSSAVREARRTSSGRRAELQAHDSLEPLRVRCGQYCTIL